MGVIGAAAAGATLGAESGIHDHPKVTVNPVPAVGMPSSEIPLATVQHSSDPAPAVSVPELKNSDIAEVLNHPENNELK